MLDITNLETKPCAKCGRLTLASRKSGLCLYCERAVNAERKQEECRAREQREAEIEAEREAVKAEAKAKARLEERRRAHAQGRWGLSAGQKTGKTAQKRRNREIAAIEANRQSDKAARANFVKQMLSAWRDKRIEEFASEFKVVMTSDRDAVGRKKVQEAVAAEEQAKRAELEAQVAKMDRLPAPPRPIVASKPKKEKKNKKGEDGDGKKGKKNKGGKGK